MEGRRKLTIFAIPLSEPNGGDEYKIGYPSLELRGELRNE